MDKILLSQNKIDELQKRYEKMKRELERQNEEHARGGGAATSWTETAVFKTTQRTYERKVKELEAILKNAHPLPAHSGVKTASIGNYVTLQDSQKKVSRFRLVHPIESDPLRFQLSVRSPLGSLLIGNKIGDVVSLNNKSFTILKISE